MAGFVAQPYQVLETDNGLPISVDDVKLWAKITGSTDNGLIERLIKGATLSAEKYTKREIRKKTFRTFRSGFGDIEETPGSFGYSSSTCPIVLRRTPVIEVVSIDYKVANVETALDLNDIDIVVTPDFYRLIPAYGKVWPGADRREHSITIEFSAGYEDSSKVPEDLKNALLAHVANLYQNRGDCGDGADCSCKFAPGEAMAVYNQYRILDFRA